MADSSCERAVSVRSPARSAIRRRRAERPTARRRQPSGPGDPTRGEAHAEPGLRPIEPRSEREAKDEAETDAARSIFVEHLDAVVERLREAARRKGMRRQEEEEFVSWALLRMVESDYSVVRQWRGDASFRGYLSVVVTRLLLDFRNHRWGKWRVSKTARALGREATLLDVLIHRDGFSTDEAVEMVVRNHRTTLGRGALREIAAALPKRLDRRLASLDDEFEQPRTAVSSDHVEAPLRRSDVHSSATRLAALLDLAFDEMDDVDLRILSMRFLDGVTAQEIAETLDLPRRRVYHRLDTVLGQLRRRLTDLGIEARDALEVVGADGIELHLRRLAA